MVRVMTVHATGEELEEECRRRTQPKSGHKETLADIICHTSPLATQAQIQYMLDLAKANSLWRFHLADMASPKAASDWISEAKRRIAASRAGNFTRGSGHM